MKPLKLKLSPAAIRSIKEYKGYKKSKNELEHYFEKLDKIWAVFEDIMHSGKNTNKVWDNQTWDYRNSKNLFRFYEQKHYVYYKITATQLQVKYFVPEGRNKAKLGSKKKVTRK